MEAQQLTSTQYINKLKIVFMALMVGQIIFALGVLVMIFSNGMEFKVIEFPHATEILLGGMSVITILFVLLSSMFFKNRLTVMKEKTVLKEMLADYQSALIIRYSILEFPSFAAIGATIITGKLLFLAFAGVIIIVLFYLMPGKERLKNDLELNQSECMLIDDPNAIVAEMKSGRI
jgi:hypothetical protein